MRIFLLSFLLFYVNCMGQPILLLEAKYQNLSLEQLQKKIQLAEFDANQNSQLDPDEQTARHLALDKQLSALRLKQLHLYDADKNGALDKFEIAAAKVLYYISLVQAYDSNNDGKLSAKEKVILQKVYAIQKELLHFPLTAPPC